MANLHIEQIDDIQKQIDAARELAFLRFQLKLLGSSASIWCTAYWLWNRGNDVTVNRMPIAPDYQHVLEYTDIGDLIVSNKWGRYLVEVKEISRPFTGLEDWPYPDKFIVDRKVQFDKKSPKPRFYIVVDNTLSYCGMVDVKKTREFWYLADVTATGYGTQPYYHCPIEHVVWMKMEYGEEQNNE